MIVKKLTSEIELQVLTAAILQQFPSTGIEQRGNVLTIEDIEDTQVNNNAINAIIAKHDYDAAIITQKINKIREERNNYLDSSDWITKRHNDQASLVTLGLLGSTSISDAKHNEWRVYQQTLRDFPGVCDPNNPAWPAKPTT